MEDTSFKYVTEFHDGELSRRLLGRVSRLMEQTGPVTLMEVCGTHTVALFRSGLRAALPQGLRLLSGPGCPVCVTPASYMDAAMEYAAQEDVIVATFGDMMRVPGSRGSLEQARAQGGDIRVVYSPTDALDTARREPGRFVVFLAVGFETTAPAVAATVAQAAEQDVKNFTVLSAHKLIPPALEALSSAPDLAVHGFICPGHVSTIIGSRPYEQVAEKHHIPCVITGFEPLDLLQGIILLLEQIRHGHAWVDIAYSRAVRLDGNKRARAVMDRVFTVADSHWRGLGELPGSGLVPRADFAACDAQQRRPVNPPPAVEPAGCRCADVLTGRITPDHCGLFGKRCTPRDPVGPCMVSSEGACAAWFKYGGEL